MFFNRLRVRAKLLLLAGVPVLGTLLLSLLVVLEVQQRVQAAAGIGSIENLAQLTGKMLHLIHDLQWERAEVTYAAGGRSERAEELPSRYEHTDGALEELSDLLEASVASELPPTLSENLNAAKEQLRRLPLVRANSQGEDFVVLDYIEYVSKINESLIGATAALTQLTSDKELMLSIGGLVSAMQVIERSSREHALLNYVFGKQEFPPGTFRYLVTLLSEHKVYLESLRVWSSGEEFARLKNALEGPSADEVARMRQVAVETTDEAVGVDPRAWFDAQAESQRALGATETAMVDAVRAVASAKVARTERAVHVALGLVASVTGASLLLAWAITRTLTRSVRELSLVADAVHEKNDYTIRAVKTSSDELGLLTDAFNGMLVGIQQRDRELDAHRRDLEALVAERTRELSERNLEMQLVLDNIDQGLAMIDREGKFLGDCSKSFAARFGRPAPGTPFYQHPTLIEGDARVSLALELGYDQLMADVLPLEVALAQLPSHIVHAERHYALSFTRITHGGSPSGALLVTRDVTEELLAARSKLEQGERAQMFERLMKDPAGFSDFLTEAGRLMQRITGAAAAEPGAALPATTDPNDQAARETQQTERMRDLHTLKGLTAVFDVRSVSAAAHELERALGAGTATEIVNARAELHARWQQCLDVVRPVLGRADRQKVELSLAELHEIVSRVEGRAPHGEILRALLELRDEPVELRLARLKDQLVRVAHYLNKPEPAVRVRAGRVRLPADRFRAFWSSLAHIVRNIVDHGLEREEDRRARGKPEKNRVQLSARADEQRVYIEIADDGRGIDWERLAERARQRGLPCASRAELIQALFADGVSTAEMVTQTSGRGVGMGAVLAACRALEGELLVESEPGRGTRFQFTFPRPALDAAAPWSDTVTGCASDWPERAPSLEPGSRAPAPLETA